MPITLAEVLQLSIDLVNRAEHAEARVKELEAALQLLLPQASVERKGYAVNGTERTPCVVATTKRDSDADSPP